MLLQSLYAPVDHIVLVGLVVLLFELEHQHGLVALFSLSEVFVEGGEILTVLEAVILEIGVIVGVDALPLNVPVVMDDQHEVVGHMDVELAAPKSGVLRGT